MLLCPDVNFQYLGCSRIMAAVNHAAVSTASHSASPPVFRMLGSEPGALCMLDDSLRLSTFPAQSDRYDFFLSTVVYLIVIN